jgi:hypothetical protein
MNIALITHSYPGGAATIEEHVAGIIAHAPGRVWRIDTSELHKVPLGAFDAIIIHYGVTIRKGYNIDEVSRHRIARFRGPKALFIQDEYRWIDATVDAMVELGIDILFTVVPQSDIGKVYHDPRLSRVVKRETYTGYVNPAYVARDVPPTADRPIDIGYRGRPLPYWLGSLGQEKTWIVDRTIPHAKRLGLTTDMSYAEESRIYGDAWPDFLTRCKAVLGSESGASVCDFTEEIRSSVDAYLARKPDASYEEVEAACFPGVDGKVVIATISPRMFEAAALRTLMILYEGDYAGVFKAGRHFVALKKDHSNFDEIAHIAYVEIAQNREYWPEALGRHMRAGFAAFAERERGTLRALRIPRPSLVSRLATRLAPRAYDAWERFSVQLKLAPGRSDQLRRALGLGRRR